MRKKSLRAMTSAVFEAPESRAEAIMQNILGANNVLVPPEAPVEEILQAILYNTPYTKEAETRIEEILLAIKNNGTYDEEAQSRDEEILISKLNQTPYTKDAESRIEELFILWAAQSVIKQLEGVPPLTFTAQGQPLINWTIYGASGGVGDKTANLFDETYPNIKKDMPEYKSVYVGNGTFTLSTNVSMFNNAAVLFLLAGNVSSGASTTNNGVSVGISRTVTAVNGYVTIAYRYYTSVDPRDSQTMLNSGSTALPYEPYGYKIPILCGGETNTIYLDTPLYDGDSISMADTGIEIPTINGQNTLAVDTTVQPEKVYIEYK